MQLPHTVESKVRTPSGHFLDLKVAEKMVGVPATLTLYAYERKGWESGRPGRGRKIEKARRLQIVWMRPSFVGLEDLSGVGSVLWYLVVEQSPISYFRILPRSYRQCYHSDQCDLLL